MLGRIRVALAGGPAGGEIPRAYRRTGTLDRSALVERLCERIGEYRAEVRRVAASDLPGAIAEAFEAREAARIAIPAGVPAAWRPGGLELVEAGELSPPELDELDGVLTGCTLAIAETGTIVLSSGPSRGKPSPDARSGPPCLRRR